MPRTGQDERKMNMPQYKDEARKTWLCKFQYTDWTGQKRSKLKRGFATKKEAAAWERDFLSKQQGSPDMTFQALYDLYMEDISHRLKDSTVNNKRYIYKNHILPYFKDRPINQIGPADVRKWQNEILKLGKAETYQRRIHDQLNTILNFAVRYYRLPQNPCKVVGAIGKSQARRMDFWTFEEFSVFIACVDELSRRMAFKTLFYTGLRCGELLALTFGDIDLEANTINVSKTYRRVKGHDVFTTPKTSGSVRKVTIPPFLADELKDYMGRFYVHGQVERIFPLTRCKMETAMKNGCMISGIKRIRIHDIRHSHVSLLIDMGFSAHLVAERIGDSVEMVNKIYGHLYPNRHAEVADRLQKLVSK